MHDNTNSPHFDPANEEAGHEPLALKIRGVVISMIGLAVLVVFTLLLASQLVTWSIPETTEREAIAPPRKASAEPPRPRVTPRQSMMYREMLAEQKENLTQSVLLDKKNNVAQIPLERAMQLLETEGLDAFDRLTGSDSDSNTNSEQKEPENK